jgi:hypothetical protein
MAKSLEREEFPITFTEARMQIQFRKGICCQSNTTDTGDLQRAKPISSRTSTKRGAHALEAMYVFLNNYKTESKVIDRRELQSTKLFSPVISREAEK